LSSLARKSLELESSNEITNGTVSIELRPYKMVREFIKWLVTQESGKIWVSKYSGYALVSLIPEKQRIMDVTPVCLAKAVKNETEVSCMKRAHVKDAVALCEFFSWLEHAIETEEITELSAAEKLEGFRK